MASLVSILIPCYNAERWIGEAIESALAQTWVNKEVIVVDDGSTDGSLEVIRGFGNQVRWETGPNRGGNVARNRLLSLAQGEWLQYLDADDYLLPDKVAAQFVRTSTGVDVVFGPVTWEFVVDQRVHRAVRTIPWERDSWELLALWHLPQTGGCLFRKQAIVDAGGWKADQPCCQEHELYLRLLMKGKSFRYCNSPGAVYRQWGEHTVCKRNMAETHRRRMEIEQAAENWLDARGELTGARLTAINQARFETARSVWRHDRGWACSIFDQIRRAQRDFQPRGAAAPPHYRVALRLLGFDRTERLAQFVRRGSPHGRPEVAGC